MAGPWEKYAQPQTIAPGRLVPVPKEPPPQTAAQAERDQLSVTRTRQEIAKNPVDLETAQLAIEEKRRKLAQGPQADATEGERKASAFLKRALGANQSYESKTGMSEADGVPGIGPRSMVGQAVANIAPNFLNSLPSGIGNSPERQIADSAQDEFIAASLRQDSGAAIPDPEIERQRRIYFAMPGDSPATQQQKREARARVIEGLVESAGRMLPAEEKDAARKYIESLGAVGAGSVAGGSPEGDGPKGFRFDDDATAALNGYLRSPGATAQGFKSLHDRLSGGKAEVTPEEAARVIDAAKANPNAAFGVDYSKIDAPVTADARALADRWDSVGPARTDAGTLANEGMSFGLSGEAAGVGNAISGVLGGDFDVGANYRTGRDAKDVQIADSRERLGGVGTAIEFGGGMLAGGSGLANSYNRIGNVTRASVGGGALAGFGYGKDEQSVTGAALGAGLGYGLAKATPYVAKGVASAYDRAVSGRAGSTGARVAARELADAGSAESVSVNRAMVDPNLESKVTRTQGSLFGGNRVTRSMEDVAGQIEAGVGRLGAGGTALESEVAGQTIQSAGERYIKQSGAVAKRQYDKAEKLAGDIRVTPLESGQAVGRLITKLSETPETNAGEIAFLQKLESDFGKDLSVGGLRRIRTQLRGKIAKGELTFGEEEANVLGIMDAASNDIANGLTSAGKASAAAAFKSADAAYRQRMQFITGTVQKLIGKRNANVTPEATFQKFKAMGTPKGDEAGLGKMMAQMEPDEVADVRATLAASLGRNGKGEFSPAFLASTAEKLPQAARVHIFGQDGAESLERLVKLAKSANRVTSQFNHSKSGVARASDAYRTAIMAVTGLGTGAGVGNVISGIAATGAAGGAMAARDMLSARALMSTNLTKWLARTPTSAADISRHVQQLSVVAAREPVIANEVLQLQARLADTFGSSPARLAADEGDPRRDPVNGRERNGQGNGGTYPAASGQARPNTGAPM